MGEEMRSWRGEAICSRASILWPGWLVWIQSQVKPLGSALLSPILLRVLASSHVWAQPDSPTPLLSPFASVCLPSLALQNPPPSKAASRSTPSLMPSSTHSAPACSLSPAGPRKEPTGEKTVMIVREKNPRKTATTSATNIWNSRCVERPLVS